MDLDQDGDIDILSGCYSRHEPDMAGLFEVLHGNAEGTWSKPQALHGTDGKPLILPKADDDDVIARICTRPFACDLDGDGKLDLVCGNFRGTFGFFRGEGAGGFAPGATWLAAADEAMEVPMHSDPFVCDWDGDGDLDIVSGSAQGGVFLFVNEGTATAPRFAARRTLLEPPADGHGPAAAGDHGFGDAHLRGPSGSTRVWVADVDADGKLDLLVGDTVSLVHCAEGVDEATARQRLVEWQQRQQRHFEAYPADGDEQAQAKWQEGYERLEAEKAEFAVDDRTGFVWLLRRK